LSDSAGHINNRGLAIVHPHPRNSARSGRRGVVRGGPSALDTAARHRYIHGHGGVAKLVIALACQAGGRGFKSRRSRYFFPWAMPRRAQHGCGILRGICGL
jgi:hypothetical protein